METIYIKNGRVFSGSNEPSRNANILIEGGRVRKISESPIEAGGAKVVDAEGKWVLPGFIDNHRHYDGELLVAPSLGESVRHGVTTVFLGGLAFFCLFKC